jgi:hypothetical protein
MTATIEQRKALAALAGQAQQVATLIHQEPPRQGFQSEPPRSAPRPVFDAPLWAVEEQLEALCNSVALYLSGGT